MTQPRNDYTKGQHTYTATVQKAQALLTAWGEEKTSVHGSKEGQTFANIVNDVDSDGDAADDDGAQESGGLATCGRAPETCCCYYCKREGKLNLDSLKLKANWAAEEAENVASGFYGNLDSAKGTTDEHAHTMLVDVFGEFNIGAEDQLFFSEAVGKFSVISQSAG